MSLYLQSQWNRNSEFKEDDIATREKGDGLQEVV